MAVTFDAVGTTGIVNASHTGGAALTYTHTVGVGANYVALGIEIVGTGSAPWATFAPTAVSIGGVAMTLKKFMGTNNVTNATGFIAVYHLKKPPTGAQTVSINCPQTGFWWANSVSYNGVGFVSAALTNFGSSANPTTGSVSSTPVVGVRVFSLLGTRNVAVSAATQTSRFTQSGTANIVSGFIQDGAGAEVVASACTALTAVWAAIALNLNPDNAVAFDGRGGFIGNDTYASNPVNVTHEITDEPGTLLLVPLSFIGTSAAPWSSFQPTVITFGGQTMQLLAFKGDNNVTNAAGFVALYGLMNPTNRGVQTLSITAGAAATFWWGSAESFTGVGQIGVPVTNSGSSVTPSTGAVPTVANTHIVLGLLGAPNVTVSANSVTGGTIFNMQQASAATTCHSGYFSGGAASSAAVTQQMTIASAPWAAIAVDLGPFAAMEGRKPMSVAVQRAAFY